MRLQSWRRPLSFDPDGRCGFFFFIPCQKAGLKAPVHPLCFLMTGAYGMAVLFFNDRSLWDGCVVF